MPVPPKADLPVVAVFNASEDTVDLLMEFFGQQGFCAVGRTWPAREPLTPHAAREFISQHRPHVVVFDVSLPYEENWERFREFQSLAGERHIPVVLTTTNRDALNQFIGPAEALEIIGKPYDLDQVLVAVRRVLPSI
jgi:DNA-binding response OmpR family regulator